MISIATIPVKTYLSKSKIPGFDYVINPYVGCPHKCVYCYAEYMRKFSGHAEAWGDFLDVKTCPVPLRPAKLFRTRVMLSSVTDPYNPYEKQYELTRNLLKQLIFCQARVYILTKSALVLRDLDLFTQMQHCEVAFSFSSADDAFRRLAESGASSVEEKVHALKTLHEAGIQTAVMVAPLFPEISDWRAILDLTHPYVTRYGFDSLNMRPAYQRKVMAFIGQHFPQFLPLYSDIYLKEKTDYWQALSAQITDYCTQTNIPAEIYFGSSRSYSGD